MITSSGIICDVCEKYILPFVDEREIFRLSFFDNDLVCHLDCKKHIEDMIKNKTHNNLPESNLKKSISELFKNKE